MVVGIMSEVERLKDLYDTESVTVSGADVSNQTLKIQSERGRGARAVIKNELRNYGVYTTAPDSRYVLEAMPMDGGGFTSASTNGYVTNFNTYTQYTEPRLYERFRNKIRDVKGRLGRYLWNKYGTPERTEATNMYTTKHEEIHNLVELHKLVKDGKETEETLKDALHRRLKQRYRKSLPRGFRFLAPYAANITLVPILEGLTEVGTENITTGKTVYQIKDEPEKCVTAYDMFKTAAAGGISETGNTDLFGYVSDWTENPTRMMDAVIDGFFDGMGRLGQTGFAAMRPVPSPKYAPAV